MPYISGALAAAMKVNAARRSIAFRMESTPPLHVWSGVGDIEAPMKNVDIVGSTYLGGGQFGGLPELRMLINGLADRIDIAMSGISEEVAGRIEADSPSIRGAPIYVGVLCFDADWQPATPIVPLCTLTADTSAIRYTAATTEGPAVVEVVLSAHYGDMGRRKQTLIHWTPPHQKLRDPFDSSMKFVNRYQVNYQVPWPRGR